MPPIPQGTAVAPAPTTVNPQGAASIAPNAAPTPSVLPQAQSPVATPAPVQAPNFNTSQTLGDIANYYNIPRQAAITTAQGQTQGNIAQQQFEAGSAENKIQIQNQQNSLNPDTYQFVKQPDGSVQILNSVGDVVPIGTYASLTGANPATALQQNGATDKADQQFIQAYNNLQTYIQTKIAAQNGDIQAVSQLADYYQQNPGLQNLELGQLNQAFMQKYGTYFGQPQGNQNALQQAGVNPTITGANNPATTSAYENPVYTAALNASPAQEALQGAAGGTGNQYQALQSANLTGQ